MRTKNKTKSLRSIIGIVLTFVLVLCVLVLVVFVVKNNDKYLSSDNNVEIIDETMPSISNKELILGNKADIVSFSIFPNSKVSGLVSYRGSVKGGYFFEGNILINVLDSNKKVLIKSNALATTNWMTSEPVSFEGYLDFSKVSKGSAYIEIHNDNASGLPENDKSILIPVIIE